MGQLNDEEEKEEQCCGLEAQPCAFSGVSKMLQSSTGTDVDQPKEPMGTLSAALQPLDDATAQRIRDGLVLVPEAALRMRAIAMEDRH